MIQRWTCQAFNQVPDSENEIHGDALAKQYGFIGGLVPGVTVTAYLLHPAIVTWGLDWLTRGFAHVRVESPLYDDETFDVRITEQAESSYAAELTRSGEVACAHGQVALPLTLDEPPTRRGDPIAEPDFKGPAATFEHWTHLQQHGVQAFRYRWGGPQPMQTYVRDVQQMPELLQLDGGGFANMSFLLSCANWILASNAHMNPWFHLETRSQNFRPVPAGTDIVAEMTVADFFEKKGHEFVDIKVALFDEQDDTCLMTIEQRAISKLRRA